MKGRHPDVNPLRGYIELSAEYDFPYLIGVNADDYFTLDVEQQKQNRV